MPSTFRLEAQIVEFVNLCPPEFQRRVKRALRGLFVWGGDVRPLRDELEGYDRQRVDRYRFSCASGDLSDSPLQT